MSPITVSKDNIEARLKNQQQNKSVGPDRIHPWRLKEVHAELALSLAALFKKSLDTKTVPQDWQNANITPIHKGVSQLYPSNYCAICLTSIIGKNLK